MTSRIKWGIVLFFSFCIIAKTKCAKSENETSKTSLFSLTFSLLIFGLCNSFQCLKDWKELEF